jgi:hypothetical protein
MAEAEEIGEVRVPPGELLNTERTLSAGEAPSEIAGQLFLVEPLVVADRRRILRSDRHGVSARE